jgi:hypothetical protein
MHYEINQTIVIIKQIGLLVLTGDENASGVEAPKYIRSDG